MRRKSNAMNAAVLTFVALIVIGLIAGIVWRRVFVVRNIVIEGSVEVSQEEIIRAAQVEMGGHITSVDAEALRVNLESGGIYALDHVRTKKPNTVILSIRKRTRDAVVRNGGKYLVMDSDGYVIEANAVMPEGGVYVYGLDATSYRIGGRITAPENRLFAMKAVLDSIRTQNAAQYVSDLTVSDPDNMMITTRTGMRVKLGDREQMDDKILWMRMAVSDLESRGDTRGLLDVSSGNKADYMP